MIEWFKDKEMKLIVAKCQLVLSDRGIKTINVGNFTIKSTKSKKLLGVTFDNKTNFQSYIENFCFKLSRTLHALASKTSNMDLQDKKEF